MHRYTRSADCFDFEHSPTGSMNSLFALPVDTCKVTNGGCDVNSLCSHDSTTNGVVCNCKTGYTNTGSATNVTCTGEISILFAPTLSTMNLAICTFIDTCLVSNGGCESNAVCSHDTNNNGVVCNCKTGYVNTANSSSVVCTGNPVESYPRLTALVHFRFVCYL